MPHKVKPVGDSLAYVLLGIEMKRGIQKQKVSYQLLDISSNSMLVAFYHHKTYAAGCFVLML